MSIQHQFSDKQHIYLVEEISTGKKYVGQACGTTKNYFCGGKYIRAALKKHGELSFTRRVLVEGVFTQQEIDDLETKYIKEYDCVIPKGYNILTKGHKYYQANNTPWNKGGGKYTPEMIQAMSDAKKGKKASEQTKQKMSKAAIGKKKSPNVGKATKLRCSKKIAQLSLFKGRILHIYDSATIASNAVYADVTNICRAARLGTVSAGFKWKYI